MALPRAEPAADWTADELAAAEHLRTASERILAECGKVIVGQTDVLEQLLIALLGRGHGLLVGVPGLAKTLMIRTLADSMNLSFNRVQFTPDLMPSDITGTEMLQEDRATGHREFRFLHGPIFANVVLADEINRTPPKTQAALLEAMQERQVTAAGTRHKLPEPFFVLATQNPIEQEGTYPLPEAQLDRFFFKLIVNYSGREEMATILERTTRNLWPTPERVIVDETGASTGCKGDERGIDVALQIPQHPGRVRELIEQRDILNNARAVPVKRNAIGIRGFVEIEFHVDIAERGACGRQLMQQPAFVLAGFDSILLARKSVDTLMRAP